MREAKTGTGRGWLRGTVLAVIMALVAGPTLAVLSDSTDRIQGTPPTGTVTLQALLPDGTTVVADSATLGWALIPNQFSVSPTVDNPTLSDADGDTGLSAIPDLSSATLNWTHNGTPLTPAQLAAPLGNNFAGETLALTVEAPVTFRSVTGLPAMGVPLHISSPYTLQVAVVIPAQLDISLDSPTAYVEGGTIMATVTARDNVGDPLPGTEIRFLSTGGQDRQNGFGPWGGINGPLFLNDTTIASAGTFTTDANGQVVVAVTNPQGLGLRRTLSVQSVSAPSVFGFTDVTFAIITSPDTPQAQMFGHMSETVTANGVTFRRPNLDAELAGDSAGYAENNETWGRYDYASAIGRVCGSEPNLPTRPELEALYAAYPSYEMNTVQGWPLSVVYRSSTIVSGSLHDSVFLNDGSSSPFLFTGSYYVACR
ncbi:adhesion domain-containing protein [Yersinia massiliensis]|nr:DUF823 domain-containing adhesin [Yersinia massiliensis]MDN0127669.1 DUF823 domain-containing adhesin [Yersinia massiliensis]